MRNVAFKMKLKPGMVSEYEKRHNEIWPELRSLLKNAGVSDYSIFFDKESNTLFAYQKIDGEAGSQDLGKEEIVQKWWAYMSDLMEVNEDNSPVTVELKEIFYLP